MKTIDYEIYWDDLNIFTQKKLWKLRGKINPLQPIGKISNVVDDENDKYYKRKLRYAENLTKHLFYYKSENVSRYIFFMTFPFNRKKNIYKYDVVYQIKVTIIELSVGNVVVVNVISKMYICDNKPYNIISKNFKRVMSNKFNGLKHFRSIRKWKEFKYTYDITKNAVMGLIDNLPIQSPYFDEIEEIEYIIQSTFTNLFENIYKHENKNNNIR